MNRRKFLGYSTAATAAVISSLDSLSLTKPSFTMNSTYELKILATNWGYTGSMDQFCAAIKKEGYDGAELWWPGTPKEQEEMFAAFAKHGLQIAFLYGAGESDPDTHFNSFKKHFEEAIGNKHQKPLYFNCHSGKDYFSFDQNKKFIDYCTRRSKETGIPVYHETHRGRILFAANITRQFMEKLPELRITFDVSHWCNVHESLLEDQAQTVEMALDRTDHIHARIGHAEGPQVNDPRAPEWANALKAHLAWWDKVVERKKKNGEPMTILTEFGPADYLPTLPYTRQPVADQWAINVHMMKMLRQRYT